MVAETVGRVGNIVGVDTHGEVHAAAVVDPQGRSLGSRFFPSSAEGTPVTGPGCMWLTGW
jgi:hypothetical protein